MHDLFRAKEILKFPGSLKVMDFYGPKIPERNFLVFKSDRSIIFKIH